MKKVCPKCGSNRLHKHGKKRRICAVCGKTCTAQSGRNKSINMEKYLLDRSTNRRIGEKEKISHVAVIKRISKELVNIPSPLFYLKNFIQMQSFVNSGCKNN